MKGLRILMLLAFAFVLALAACKKDKQGCVDEESFCELVEDGNFEGSTNVMSNYLASLISSNNQKLEKLKDWLECKRCVEEVYIPCFSCIEEPPPTRTIGIDFIQNGEIVNIQLVVHLNEQMESAVVTNLKKQRFSLSTE